MVVTRSPGLFFLIGQPSSARELTPLGPKVLPVIASRKTEGEVKGMIALFKDSSRRPCHAPTYIPLARTQNWGLGNVVWIAGGRVCQVEPQCLLPNKKG